MPADAASRVDVVTDEAVVVEATADEEDVSGVRPGAFAPVLALLHAAATPNMAETPITMMRNRRHPSLCRRDSTYSSNPRFTVVYDPPSLARRTRTLPLPGHCAWRRAICPSSGRWAGRLAVRISRRCAGSGSATPAAALSEARQRISGWEVGRGRETGRRAVPIDGVCGTIRGDEASRRRTEHDFTNGRKRDALGVVLAMAIETSTASCPERALPNLSPADSCGSNDLLRRPLLWSDDGSQATPGADCCLPGARTFSIQQCISAGGVGRPGGRAQHRFVTALASVLGVLHRSNDRSSPATSGCQNTSIWVVQGVTDLGHWERRSTGRRYLAAMSPAFTPSLFHAQREVPL